MNPRELLGAYLDGECKTDEIAELQRWLREDPDHVRIFVREAHAHRMLRDFAVAQQVQAQLKVVEAPARARSSATLRFRRWWFLAGAAACVALALSLALWLQTGTPNFAILKAADQGVIVRRGTADIAAHGGLALNAQDLIRVPANASASIDFADETHLALQAGTEIILQPSQVPVSSGAIGKAVSLASGSLNADVAMQPTGEPFLFFSPHASAVVLGTKLEFKSDDHSTRLNVAEGRVRFSRLNATPAIEVASGGFALADGAVVYSNNAVPPKEENVHVLDDHESGELIWEQYPDTSPVTLGLSTSQAHGGKRSLRVDYKFSEKTPDPYTEIFHPLSLKAGDRALRFYIFIEKSGPASGWNIQFRLRDRSCWMVADGDFSDLAAGWNCVEIDLQKPPSTQTFGESTYDSTQADGLLFSVCRGSATFYIDDVTILGGANSKP